MYYSVVIEATQKIAFVQKRADNSMALTFYTPLEKKPQDISEEADEQIFEVSQIRLVRRVYVISLPCFRATGPWAENVYCIQGPHSHPLDDGDSFLAWCHQFRTAIQKGIKSTADSGSTSVLTPLPIFQSIFGRFIPQRTIQDMGYSSFLFTPPKDNITSRDKGFISGFTERESATAKLIHSYLNPDIIGSNDLGQGIRLVLRKPTASIQLGQGLRSQLQGKLKSMKKSSPTHPSIPHVHILKEEVNGKYVVFKQSLTFAQIQELESLIGKFCKKGNRAIRQKRTTDLNGVPENPKFKITYRPSKFKLRIRFSHLSD